MHEFNISEKELQLAILFFSSNDIEALTAQAIKINQSQPNFSAVVLALERHGLDRIKVEDLLESIFVVYYAQTELRQRKMNRITFKQIKENVKWFGEFISYFNEEKKTGNDDLLSLKFLRDDVVLDYAFNTLGNLFGDPTKIPQEVVFGYFSLLKAIEMGTEKG